MTTKHFYLKVHSDPVDSICWDFLLRTDAIRKRVEDVQSACILLLIYWRWLLLRHKVDIENNNNNNKSLALTSATSENTNVSS